MLLEAHLQPNRLNASHLFEDFREISEKKAAMRTQWVQHYLADLMQLHIGTSDLGLQSRTSRIWSCNEVSLLLLQHHDSELIGLDSELAAEDALDSREHLRDLRRLDRKQQKERLDDIAPRAEAGSKDRMLEKKREKADSNRAFATGKTEAGGVEDVPESDLLGGEDEGIEGYKKQKRDMDRKKNERELRREEMLRARQAEREQRIQEYKAKEERTMSGLVALAKARFG